jgi:RNase H-like domain found in reverse transcriptase
MRIWKGQALIIVMQMDDQVSQHFFCDSVRRFCVKGFSEKNTQFVSCRLYRPYLNQQQFFIYSYHFSLQFLDTMRLSSNSRLARWALYLQSFRFTICYGNGRFNTAADALSRVHTYCHTPNAEPECSSSDDELPI